MQSALSTRNRWVGTWGADGTAGSRDTVQLPPTLFCTSTGWPSASPRRGGRSRATMWGPPPGGMGTRRRMGFEGNCASAADQQSAMAMQKRDLTARCIASRRNAVEIVFPDVEIALARRHRGVLHFQLPRELFDGAPTGVRVLDVGCRVQLEKLQFGIR